MKTLLRLSLCLFVCCLTGSPSEARRERSVCQAEGEITLPPGEWGVIVSVHGLEVVLQRKMGSGLAVTRDGGETWALIEGSAPTPTAPVFSASDTAWSLEDGELWRLGPFRGAWAKVTSANPLADGLDR
jgi:hypothetical protein